MDLGLICINSGGFMAPRLCIRSPFFAATGVEIEEN